MSLLKVNEVQNYNGSSLTLTASTVSTSAQLNTGGNVSVTGSINVSDDSTTRSNLGLGSIATQNSDNVTITGGNISNATLASSVTFPTGTVIGMAFLADVTNGSGGTSSTAATLRRLNTSVFNINCPITLASNEISFDEAGTYVINASAPVYKGERHILRLSEDSGSSFIGTGTAEYTATSSSHVTRSFLVKNVSISASEITGAGSQRDFGFFHTVDVATSGFGLGVDNSDTTVEQYLQVQIFRLA